MRASILKLYYHLTLKWFANKTNFLWILIAGFAIGISASIQYLPQLTQTHSANEWLRDRFIQFRADPSVEERIILIDIDENSIEKIGPWPWKRSQIAELIEKLISTHQAQGVALDIFFPKEADAQGDERLAALGQFAPVVFAQVFDFQLDRPSSWEFGELSGDILPSQFPSKHSPFYHSYATGYIANHAKFKNAQFAGNIGFVPDIDGTLRFIPSSVFYKDKIYLPLARALFDCCATKTKPVTSYGQLEISNQKGQARVNFSKELAAYKVISASDILQDNLHENWLKNKLFIIGSSSLSLADRVATPLHSSTSGFLIHAQVLTDILNAQVSQPKSQLPGRVIALFYTIFVVGFGFFIIRKYSAFFSTFMLALASLIWIALAFWLAEYDLWFSLSGPLFVNFFLLAVAIPFAWHTSQNKSKHLLETLNLYVAPSVVKELMRSDLKDPLAPRKLNVTTLIADMARYTSHIEKLPIEDAALLTKDFLECLTEPVLEKGGTLDKYTGDGLVAFWGAPLPITNHADQAIDAAIAMIANVKLFNLNRLALQLPEINIRIGIETGIAIAGDFGSTYRSIYTAIGDSVNTASRLEDACREYPFSVIVGQGTVNASIKHRFIFIEEKILKGKEYPTLLYTVELPE